MIPQNTSHINNVKDILIGNPKIEQVEISFVTGKEVLQPGKPIQPVSVDIKHYIKEQFANLNSDQK